MNPKETLIKFDKYLADRRLEFETIVIGGSALALLGIITHETQDCDVLDPGIPSDIAEAARQFTREIADEKQSLKEDWLNNAPESLKGILPKGWRVRLEKLYSGKALKLHTLGRSDLLKTKLFAFCDRGQDLQDCIALRPSREELRDALA